jgi:hypothetical protein
MIDASIWWRVGEIVIASGLMLYVMRLRDERTERQTRFLEQLLEIRIQPHMQRQTCAVEQIYSQLDQLGDLLGRLIKLHESCPKPTS